MSRSGILRPGQEPRQGCRRRSSTSRKAGRDMSAAGRAMTTQGALVLLALATAGLLAASCPRRDAGRRDPPRPRRSSASPRVSAAAQRAALVRAAGGTVTYDLHIIDGLGVRLSARAMARLRGAAGVRSVTPAAPVATRATAAVRPLNAYPSAVGATAPVGLRARPHRTRGRGRGRRHRHRRRPARLRRPAQRRRVARRRQRGDQPARDLGRRRLRPRHPRRRDHRRQRHQPRRLGEGGDLLHRRGARGAARQRQGRRRPGQGEHAGRHLRHPVRGRPRARRSTSA